MPSTFSSLASKFISQQSASSSESPLFYSTAQGYRSDSGEPEEEEEGGKGSEGEEELDGGTDGGSVVDPFKPATELGSEEDDEDASPVNRQAESIALVPPPSAPPPPQTPAAATYAKSAHPTPPGWRAHPPSSPSSESTPSTGSSPPAYLLDQRHSNESSDGSPHGPQDSMLESLLPQDQLRIRPGMGHVTRLPHAGYTVLFGGCLVVSTVLSLYALIFTPKSSPLPHLTHTLPLLTLLAALSLLLPPVHIALLRIAVKPALYGTYFLLPVLVFAASAYAFAGSFWSQSIALRILSFVPLIPLLLMLPSLPRRLPSLARSSSLLSLSSSVLLSHPSALAAIMIGALAGAIGGGIVGGGGVRLIFGGSLPTWLASLPLLTTLLAYATLLSLRRIALGSIVARWYLAIPPRSPPDQHESTREAVLLATGPQFGTAVLGALILSFSRALVLLVYLVQRLVGLPWIPPQCSPTAFLLYLLGSLEGYNGKAMLLTGISPSGKVAGTGGSFWASVQDVRELERGRGRLYRNYDLTRTLLTLLVLLSAVLAALAAYFYSSDSGDSGLVGSAKWRERKAEDVWAAVLAGVLCWGMGEFGLGSLSDVSDALWMCFSMDLDAGREPRVDVAAAFEGRPREGLQNDIEGLPGNFNPGSVAESFGGFPASFSL